MSEETEKTEETQQAQGTQGTPNGTATEDELATIKAELEAERGALAGARAALTEKDERIAELQAEGEALRAERSNLEEAHVAAADKYLAAQRSLHPEVPSALIKGATIKEVDESVKAGLQVVEAVRATLAAGAKQNRVPAGAPTREVNIDALSPDEKIKLGLAQNREGGTN